MSTAADLLETIDQLKSSEAFALWNAIHEGFLIARRCERGGGGQPGRSHRYLRTENRDERQMEFDQSPPPDLHDGWPEEVVTAAVALKRELDKPPAPPPLPALSLYKIESAIFQLLDALDEAEADGDIAAIAAMLMELSRYTAAEPAKVDGICYSIRECERRGEVADAESARLKAMAKRWESRATRIKESALHAMLDHGVKSVESATNWMRPQRNSSAKLDVYDPGAVPNDLKYVTLNLTWAEWVKLETALEACELGDWLGGLRVRRKMEVDTDRVKEALEVLVTCKACDGHGGVPAEVTEENPNPDTTCPVCQGKGTMTATVPGARLLERGYHLRLSRPPKEQLEVEKPQ